ncbi:MAG: hypothetical protein Fur0022_38840 [Anaerolineales bacterium]
MFQVYVIDQKSGDDIPNAEIKLQLPEVPPITKVTNTEGLAIFELDMASLGEIVSVTIEVTGYSRSVTTIQLDLNYVSPYTVMLEASK